jgi:hypothetical protein
MADPEMARSQLPWATAIQGRLTPAINRFLSKQVEERSKKLTKSLCENPEFSAVFQRFSRLLAQALSDRDTKLADLESSSLENVPFYEKHGFEVVTKIQGGTSSTIVPMVRKPR